MKNKNAELEKKVEKLMDALNRIDELAFEATEEVKTLKQLKKDYILIANFLRKDLIIKI